MSEDVRTAPVPAADSIALDEGRFYVDEARANAAFRWLRREAPVWRFEPRGFWVVSRLHDVQSMSQRPELWSSAAGVTMPFGGDRPDRNADASRAASIIQMDPPEHNRHRSLVSRAFTPRRVAGMEARMREIAVQSIEDTPTGTPIDFVENIAMPLPMRVIAEMLGVPEDDMDDFRRWSDAVVVQAGADSDRESGMEAIAEIFGYFAETLAKRRATPGDDLITALLHAELDGRRLEESEILIFCMTLLVAGNETTRTMVSQGTRLLLEHPEQLALLRSGAVSLPDAIEELLRVVHPIRYFFRGATRDIEMHGVTIRAADPVMMLYAAANRDETVWGEDADHLDITRAVQPHVSLGFGQHFCLGASLARLEARVLFEELLARRSRWESAGEVEFVDSSFINGIGRMPVVLSR
jgi:cytochrome P450